MTESVFFDGVRGLFASIDRAIYSLISTFYDTIGILTTKTTIISSSALNEITNKIYALIALFMIFKISFSLINYVVNPDLIVDKTKGGGVLIKNILITFVLVITVPFAFNLLYQAQSAIINDGVIEKLFNTTGEGGTTGTRSIIMDDNYCENNPAVVSYDAKTGEGLGDYISLIAFKTFFQIDEQADESDINEALNAGYCRASVVDGKSASVGNLLRLNSIYNAPSGNSLKHIYAVDYSFFISTIVGIVLALVFLSFCFDVAVRTIKLQFLELLAPIPIISYIDPDKSKNGMFSKWVKEVATTWLSLFMRLLALNFAIYFISFINDSDIVKESLWMTLLIIIGILMFAKQLPKLLENIMGIKASGSFNLNPLKKLDNEALGGKMITGLGAGAIGAVGGGVAGGIAGAHAGATGRGTLLGIANGFKNGKSDTKHAFSSGMSKTYKDLTGNEMVNLTPSKVLMGLGNKGKSSVNEVKGSLKTARSRLNNANTRLNQASYHNQISSEKLRNLGVSTNDLAGARQRASINLSSLAAKKSELENDLSVAKVRRASYETAKNFVDNYKPIFVDENGKPMYSSEYKKYNDIVSRYDSSEISKLQTDYDKINNEYNNNMQIISEIDSYVQTAAEENALRSEISKIEKEISTLGDEKKQRERFYQYDSSPKTSVEEAMKNNPPS